MVKKILVAGLLCASLALAQGKRGSSSNGGDMGSMGGGPMAANRFDDISSALNLTKDQKKAVRTILDDGAKEAAPLRDQISKSRVAVGEAITAKKSEDELKQVAKTSSDLAVQLSQLEIKTFAKIFASLDDTQKKDMRGLGRALSLMNDIYHNKNWTEE
jgi:Spy/CpxP family protein refolding chaperone